MDAPAACTMDAPAPDVCRCILLRTSLAAMARIALVNSHWAIEVGDALADAALWEDVVSDKGSAALGIAPCHPSQPGEACFGGSTDGALNLVSPKVWSRVVKEIEERQCNRLRHA